MVRAAISRRAGIEQDQAGGGAILNAGDGGVVQESAGKGQLIFGVNLMGGSFAATGSGQRNSG